MQEIQTFHCGGVNKHTFKASVCKLYDLLVCDNTVFSCCNIRSCSPCMDFVLKLDTNSFDFEPWSSSEASDNMNRSKLRWLHEFTVQTDKNVKTKLMEETSHGVTGTAHV